MWDAPAVVLVVAAVGASLATAIKTWKDGDKIDQIHTNTNSGMAELRKANELLTQKFDTFMAAQLAASTAAHTAATVRITQLEQDIIKRADAAPPSGNTA